MLYREVPSSKVHFSKKIVSFEQDGEGVTITLGDNTTARGDILVGADGAHSAVRNHLYKSLDKQGLLPKSDTGAMSVAYVSLLGTTDALDPAKYPCVLKEYCDIKYIIGDKKTPYTVSPISLFFVHVQEQ
jgi:2-polyprenyl-6-methoxyphenol hydroxylase-like FAD-dependent oxidoreductase